MSDFAERMKNLSPVEKARLSKFFEDLTSIEAIEDASLKLEQELADLRQRLAASQQEAAAGQARLQAISELVDDNCSDCKCTEAWCEEIKCPGYRILEFADNTDTAALDAALAARDDEWLDMLIEACKAEDDWKVPGFDPLATGILLIKSTLNAFLGLDEHNAMLAKARRAGAESAAQSLVDCIGDAELLNAIAGAIEQTNWVFCDVGKEGADIGRQNAAAALRELADAIRALETP